MKKFIGRILVFFALILVLLQAFSVPIIAAVAKPWTGTPWTGNSWSSEGWSADGWSGNSWEGSSWSIPPFSGNPWDGNGWNSSDWDGSSWSSTPWYLNPWMNNGWNSTGNPNGNGWGGNGWNSTGNPNGNGWGNNGWNSTGNPNGNGWGNNGWNSTGNPNGNGWGNNGWNSTGNSNGNAWNSSSNPNGNGWNGQGGNGSPWNNPNYAYDPMNPLGPNFPSYFPPSGSSAGGGGGSGGFGDPNSILDIDLPYGYEVAKYVGNDIIGGQIGMIGDFMENPNQFPAGSAGSFYTNLVLNGVKVGMGDKTPWYINGASETVDAYSKVKDGSTAAMKLYNTLNPAGTIGSTQTRGAITGLNVGAVSKFNVVTSAIGAGYGAFETGFKGAKAIDVLKSNADSSKKVSAVADATASLGETMMNAGVVLEYFPGTQVAGTVLIAGGAVIWGASKLTKLAADNWDKIVKVKDKAAKAISNGWKKVKGWFS
nr:hypothetical protein [Heyndrickxia oleronia]